MTELERLGPLHQEGKLIKGGPKLERILAICWNDDLAKDICRLADKVQPPSFSTAYQDFIDVLQDIKSYLNDAYDVSYEDATKAETKEEINQALAYVSNRINYYRKMVK